MAGQPKKRAIIAELTKRAREEIGEDATPLDYACEWISSGKTLVQLATSVSKATSLDIMREQLSRVLNAIEDGAEARLVAARTRGGHSLVERAHDVVLDADLDRDALTKAKLIGDSSWRLASVWNRAELGEQKQAAVTINLNTLHIDSLRAAGSAPLIEQGIHNPKVLPRAVAQLVDEIVVNEVEDEQLSFDMPPRMPSEG